MKHGGKSRAQLQLKHFTKKLTVPSLSLTDNPLHWEKLNLVLQGQIRAVHNEGKSLL